jgi:mitogen-activated protein kinase 1/3
MRNPHGVQVFENAKRIYREIRILRLLNHPNIIKVTHLQAPRLARRRRLKCASCDNAVLFCSDLLSFTDLYIVFECMDTDFAKLTRDDTQCLTVPHVRWFLYQLLLSMKYVHSARIIHRDIKPANILLSEACDLKLCDFGLARTLEEETDGHEDEEVRDMLGVANRTIAEPEDTPASTGTAGSDGTSGSGILSASNPIARSMTRHVVTRWYRAPELPLYNDGTYTVSIDVWSVGCVYAEMLGMLVSDPCFTRVRAC